jgi:hypothetical protein
LALIADRGTTTTTGFPVPALSAAFGAGFATAPPLPLALAGTTVAFGAAGTVVFCNGALPGFCTVVAVGFVGGAAGAFGIVLAFATVPGFVLGIAVTGVLSTVTATGFAVTGLVLGFAALVFGTLTLAGLGVSPGLLGAGFPVAAAGLDGVGLVWPEEASRAASLSAAFCCCTAFSLSWVSWIRFGLCAPAPPAIIMITRMPVVSFIGLSTF